MATRVIPAELRELVTTAKTDQVLQNRFIADANLFVNEHLTAAGMSAERLKVIELYLAAHFLTISEENGGVVADRYGDASQRYADVYQGGLLMTRFGQQAVVLDPSGILVNVAVPKKKAEFRVI